MSDPVPLLAGLVAVVVGAELVVRHGAGLAARFGIPPILIGMTVIALATSLPELAVGLSAVRHDSPDLAVGNIIGTNLVNVLLVLGLSAVLRPILFEDRTLRVDLPVMAGTALVLLLLALDGDFSSIDGLTLTVLGVAYLTATIAHGLRAARAGRSLPGVTGPMPAETARSGARSGSALPAVLLLLLGLVVVVVGSELLVDGAAGLARSLGISEAVVGLTIIAVGTSAPELVTTIVSTVRDERDLAIGNLLGSSVFNIALVLGPTILVAEGSIPVPRSIIQSDLALMVVVALLCVPAFWSHRRLGRIEGGLFVAAYAGYVAWMVIGLS